MLAAEVEILAHAHFAEELARLRALHDAAAGNGSGARPGEAPSPEADRAAVRHEPGDGIKECRLAGAVESDDRDEFALAHLDVDPIERLRLTIENAYIGDVEQWRCSGRDAPALRRRLDLAADIDAAHGFVAHHFLGGTLRDALTEIHR